MIWATYAAGLGYVFGSTFEDNHTLAFLLAFGCALSVTLIVEVVRHQRSKNEEEARRVGALTAVAGIAGHRMTARCGDRRRARPVDDWFLAQDVNAWTSLAYVVAGPRSSAWESSAAAATVSFAVARRR